MQRRSKNDPTCVGHDELIALYKGFGFYIEHGKKHDLAKHPNLPDGVKATVTRSSKELHPDYVRTAVSLIEMATKEKGK